MVLPFLCMVAALVSTSLQQVTLDSQPSPCPNLFRYESIDQAGKWTGTLSFQSQDELHGLWMRLIFDNPITKLNVDGDYEVVLQAGHNDVLIKNKNTLVKAGSTRNIQLTVKYDGSKFPKLIEYRLNAKTVCPHADTKNTDLFQGDEHSTNFLTELTSIPKIDQTAYSCGIKASKESPTYPWMADIFVKNNYTEKYICEAILISPSHLVTAAHCVTFKNDNTKIPVSNLGVYLAEKTGLIKNVVVSEIKIHPGYDPDTLFNDIAVIQLNAPLEINDDIRPICLNEKSDLESGSSLIGYQIEGNGDISNHQIETSVRRLDPSECRKKAPELENILGEDTYCLTYLPSNSLCAGYSGSSFVTFKDNIATLRGIVRVGILLQNRTRCDEDSVILVTSTDKHLKWIVHALS